MKYTFQANSLKARREFSFAEPLETANDKAKSRCSSPSIAYEYGINHNNKDKHYSSPIHNLHYKYLPSSYQSRQEISGYSNDKRTKPDQIQKTAKIESMGQINKKIKNILDSIQNEQKRKDYYCQKFGINLSSDNQRFSRQLPKFQTQSSAQCRQISSIQTSNRPYTHQRAAQQQKYTNNIYKFKQSPLIRSNYRTPLKQRNIFERGSNQYSNMSSIKTQKNYQSPMVNTIQPEISSKRLVTCPNNSAKSQSQFQYISRIKNSVYSNLPSSRFIENKENQPNFVKDKDISLEIDKIQHQIQELERIKKQLKNNYDKTGYSNVKSSQATKFSKDQNDSIPIQSCKSSIADILKESQICVKNIPSKGQNQDQQTMNLSLDSNAIASNQLQKSKKKVNQQDVYVPKILRNLQLKTKKSAQKTVLNSSFQSKTDLQNYIQSTEKNLQVSHQNSYLKIQKPKIQNNYLNKSQLQTKEYDQIKRLLHHIDQQIKLDQIFRKIKKWFQRSKSDQKWKHLSIQLKECNLWISQQRMKSIFSISSQEQNPFYTPRDQDFTINQLVTAYRQNQENWNRYFLHHYSESKLANGGFTQQNIDISKRKFIAIEDLVRYINYEMDSFFRNRDVYLIFQRLKKGQKLLFSDIIQSFTNK